MERTRQIILEGELGEQFGREHNLVCNTPREALFAMEILNPGFAQAIRSDGYYEVILADEVYLETNDLEIQVTELVPIKIVPVLAGEKFISNALKGATKIIAGVVLIAAAILAPGPLAAGSLLVKTSALIGGSLLLGGIAELLVPTPQLPDFSGLGPAAGPGNRPSYFAGPQNIAQGGRPVPLIYGKVMVGGNLISYYVSVRDIVDEENLLRSETVATFVDLLGEGELAGAIRAKVDGVELPGGEGSDDENKLGVRVRTLYGAPWGDDSPQKQFTLGSIIPLPQAGSQEFFTQPSQVIGVGQDIRKDTEPTSRELPNIGETKLDIVIRIPALTRANDKGETLPHSVQFEILLRKKGMTEWLNSTRFLRAPGQTTDLRPVRQARTLTGNQVRQWLVPWPDPGATVGVTYISTQIHVAYTADFSSISSGGFGITPGFTPTRTVHRANYFRVSFAHTITYNAGRGGFIIQWVVRDVTELAYTSLSVGERQLVDSEKFSPRFFGVRVNVPLFVGVGNVDPPGLSSTARFQTRADVLERPPAVTRATVTLPTNLVTDNLLSEATHTVSGKAVSPYERQYTIDLETFDKQFIFTKKDDEVQIAEGYLSDEEYVEVNGEPSASDNDPRSVIIHTRRLFGAQFIEFADEPWEVLVRRISDDDPEPTDAASTRHSQIVWSAYSVSSGYDIRYSDSAIAVTETESRYGWRGDSRHVEVFGRKIRIPTNYDPVQCTYEDPWDGQFAEEFQYSNNPVWVFLDVLTNRRFGLGQFLSLSDINRFSLYKLARYCDEPVPSGRLEADGKTKIMERRFTINTQINNASEAFRMLQDLAQVFRGMIHWEGNSLFLSQDAPADPVQVFSDANVLGGPEAFVREGAGLKAKFSEVTVSWNNPEDDYAVHYETVEDAELLLRYGRRVRQLVGFGCTSQGQAQRIGRYLLETNKLERDVISFSTSFENLSIRPGDIIAIRDKSFAGQDFKGRASITQGPDPDLEQQLARVLSVSEEDKHIVRVIAAEHVPEKFDYIDEGTDVTPPVVVSPHGPSAPQELYLRADVIQTPNPYKAYARLVFSWSHIAGVIYEPRVRNPASPSVIKRTETQDTSWVLANRPPSQETFFLEQQGFGTPMLNQGVYRASVLPKNPFTGHYGGAGVFQREFTQLGVFGPTEAPRQFRYDLLEGGRLSWLRPTKGPIQGFELYYNSDILSREITYGIAGPPDGPGWSKVTDVITPDSDDPLEKYVLTRDEEGNVPLGWYAVRTVGAGDLRSQFRYVEVQPGRGGEVFSRTIDLGPKFDEAKWKAPEGAEFRDDGVWFSRHSTITIDEVPDLARMVEAAELREFPVMLSTQPILRYNEFTYLPDVMVRATFRREAERPLAEWIPLSSQDPLFLPGDPLSSFVPLSSAIPLASQRASSPLSKVYVFGMGESAEVRVRVNGANVLRKAYRTYGMLVVLVASSDAPNRAEPIRDTLVRRIHGDIQLFSRTSFGQDISVPRDGVARVIYEAPFLSIPELLVIMQEAEPGWRYRISSQRTDGFDLTFTDRNGNPVQPTFDWEAKGV